MSHACTVVGIASDSKQPNHSTGEWKDADDDVVRCHRGAFCCLYLWGNKCEQEYSVFPQRIHSTSVG